VALSSLSLISPSRTSASVYVQAWSLVSLLGLVLNIVHVVNVRLSHVILGLNVSLILTINSCCLLISILLIAIVRGHPVDIPDVPHAGSACWFSFGFGVFLIRFIIF
jgi:hypothetical protein